MNKSSKQTPEYCSEEIFARRMRRKKLLKDILSVTAIVADVVGVILAIKGAGFTTLGRIVGLTTRTASRSRFLV